MNQQLQQDSIEKAAFAGRFRSLFRLMDGHRLLYAIAMLAVGLAALARVGVFYLLGYLVDEVLPSQEMRQLLPLVASGFIGLAILQGLFSFSGGRLAAKTSESIVRNLRDYLYDHMQRLPFSFHDRNQTGELLQRATSDVDTIRKLFTEQIIGIGRIIFVFIVSFTALGFVNWTLAWASIVVIPIILVVSAWFFRVNERLFESFQEQDAKLTNRLQENLTGVRVVKAFARQQYEIDKFEIENDAKFHRGTDLTWAHSFFWPTTDIILGLQMVGAYYLGARMAINGTISPGDFLIAVGLVSNLIWPIRNLGRLISDVSTGVVSFGRISSVIRSDKEPVEAGSHPKDTVKGDISFKNVSFAYEGEKAPVLHDISFEVKAGQTIALLGSTGSGKTSLVNLLPRFYEYTAGSIQLDQVELNTIVRSDLRQHIGIVMQEPFLFATTIRDNITYGVGREVSEGELYAAARVAAVHDVIMGFPNGYDTLVGEKGVTLSGGQKQRVTLARTILQNPPILIMDDATSAVDTETESVIRNALNNADNTRTTFIIAHRVTSVMHADLILVLDGGRIIQSGTHSDLIDQSGVYQQIYQLQSGIEADLMAELAALDQHANLSELPLAG